VLGIPAGKLDPRQPLDALGFDSLMAVELVVAIEQKVGIRLQKMSLLRAGMTVLDLVQIIEENLAKTPDDASPNPVPAAPPADPPGPPQTPVPAPHFMRFSDEQVDTLLESLLLETQENAGTRAAPESVSC
jgi:acyl carrier protein